MEITVIIDRLVEILEAIDAADNYDAVVDDIESFIDELALVRDSRQVRVVLSEIVEILDYDPDDADGAMELIENLLTTLQ